MIIYDMITKQEFEDLKPVSYVRSRSSVYTTELTMSGFSKIMNKIKAADGIIDDVSSLHYMDRLNHVEEAVISFSKPLYIFLDKDGCRMDILSMYNFELLYCDVQLVKVDKIYISNTHANGVGSNQTYVWHYLGESTNTYDALTKEEIFNILYNQTNFTDKLIVHLIMSYPEFLVHKTHDEIFNKYLPFLQSHIPDINSNVFIYENTNMQLQGITSVDKMKQMHKQMSAYVYNQHIAAVNSYNTDSSLSINNIIHSTSSLIHSGSISIEFAKVATPIVNHSIFSELHIDQSGARTAIYFLVKDGEYIMKLDFSVYPTLMIFLSCNTIDSTVATSEIIDQLKFNSLPHIPVINRVNICDKLKLNDLIRKYVDDEYETLIMSSYTDNSIKDILIRNYDIVRENAKEGILRSDILKIVDILELDLTKPYWKNFNNFIEVTWHSSEKLSFKKDLIIKYIKEAIDDIRTMPVSVILVIRLIFKESNTYPLATFIDMMQTLTKEDVIKMLDKYKFNYSISGGQ